jgi:hypothetical protein
LCITSAAARAETIRFDFEAAPAAAFNPTISVGGFTITFVTDTTHGLP